MAWSILARYGRFPAASDIGDIAVHARWVWSIAARTAGSRMVRPLMFTDGA